MNLNILQKIGDNLPDGALFRFVHELDTEKMYMEYVSATWEKVTAIDAQSVCENARVMFDVVHPYDLQYLKTAASTCELNLTYLDITVRVGIGNFRWLRSVSQPHKEENKIVFDGLIRDVTEYIDAQIELEKHSEQLENLVTELMHAKEKAEESDKLKSALLANVSHEIRTPLNAILGFLNILELDDIPKEAIREYSSIINSNSMRLLHLIENIMDVSKIEVQQMELYPSALNINDLMTKMMMFAKTNLRSAEKEHIDITLDKSGFLDECIINIDEKRLHQILAVLLGNAVKYTEKGYIRFGYVRRLPDMLEFFVEDTGIGINKDKQKIIFDSFRQAEWGNTRTYEGIGLGLTISRGLVRLMGGDMRVKSDQGKGATFYFTIPL